LFTLHGKATIIEGSFSHERDYWFDKNGERKREPNRECFAEYYGRILVPEGKSKQAGLDSIDEFLPNSRKHMDKIFDGMIGGTIIEKDTLLFTSICSMYLYRWMSRNRKF
jgi:hypothetical protein